MQRSFSPGEIEKYLPHCFDYVAGAFGAEECIALDRLRDYRAKGAHFYQPYGDFSQDPPKILGIVNSMLISHEELTRIKLGKRKETELDAWQPQDGKAVLWVASVVSNLPGVAVKCIAGVLDQLEASPYKNDIDTLAVFATGPKGIVMAEKFGFVRTGGEYRDQGMPFLERGVRPGDLAQMGNSLLQAWDDDMRETVRFMRQTYGAGWKQHLKVAGNG